jgi:CheY-like chemotaxis protein
MPTQTRLVRSIHAAAQGLAILIVDDDVDVLMTLSDSLQDLIPGVRIYPAESAAEALHYLSNHTVDLLITDYKMPDLTGLELIETMRQSKAIPAILMTGHPSTGLAYRALHEAHIAAIFAKPFESEAMAAKAIEVMAMHEEPVSAV